MQVLNNNGQQGVRIMLSLSSFRALFNVKQYNVNYDRIRVFEDVASVSTGRAFTMLMLNLFIWVCYFAIGRDTS